MRLVYQPGSPKAQFTMCSTVLPRAIADQTASFHQGKVTLHCDVAGTRRAPLQPSGRT